MKAQSKPLAFRALGVVVGMPGLPLRESVDLARRAEDAGLGIVAAGEGPLENFSFLGALAVSTSRVELLTTVAGWTRTPVTTAIGASTIQGLAGGRYRLTLGPTPRDWSERWHDVSYDRPVERMRDYVAAVRAAWRTAPGAPGAHEGPCYRFSAYEHALPEWAPVPLYLAATRPRMCRLAGEVADGVVLNLMLTPGWLRDVATPELEAGRRLRDRVRPFDVGLLRMAAVDDDPARARDLVRPGLGFYFTVPYLRDVLEHEGLGEEARRGYAAAARGDASAMAAAVSDRMVDAMALAGTASDVRRLLSRYEGLVDWVEVMPPIGLGGARTRQQTLGLVEALAAAPLVRSGADAMPVGDGGVAGAGTTQRKEGRR